ncbi:hypothetical protein H4V99_001243 [Cryobacterium sp. CG_9.6]|nr:hypothetical protein [Cryobacterium sp. CG_9.6]MDH6236498.1 hypothetical protein [Cryobacterium sp. CG_9.6]
MACPLGGGVVLGGVVIEDAEQVPGDVAFQDALDLFGCLAFLRPFLDVGGGRRVVVLAVERGDPDGGVERPVATAVQTVADGVAR